MIATTLASEKKKFTMKLCQEHLEEAAFLYALQQNILVESSATGWSRARDFEERLNAHLRALVIEGHEAIELSKCRMTSSDPGDLYVLTRLACQNSNAELLELIVQNLDLDNDRKVKALCNGLIDEASGQPAMVAAFLAAHFPDTRILISVAIAVRSSASWQFMDLGARQAPEGPLNLILRLAGRTNNFDALPLLAKSLGHEEEPVRSEAALALLRLGENGPVLAHCYREKEITEGLGLGGGQEDATFLLPFFEDGQLTRGLLLACGLLGESTAIPALIESLENEDFSELAALMLEIITGAGLTEDIFIPEEIDPQELFKDEVEKIGRGESLYPPGEEPGITVTRISESPAAWREWLENNRELFAPGVRYRNGRPYSPECLIENMKSETLPRFLRQLAYEELVIRYTKDFPFHTDRPASFQQQAIAQYEAWSKATANSYQKGQYYFAGLLMK